MSNKIKKGLAALLQDKVTEDDFSKFGTEQKIQKKGTATATSIAIFEEDKKKITALQKTYLLEEDKIVSVSEIYRRAIDLLYNSKVSNNE